MHRIDGSGAAPGGAFTEGDPVVGTPSTVVTADWLNAVQEELAGVVVGAGIPLAKPNNGQVLAALRALIDQAVPVGTVLMGYFTNAKPGYVMGRGALVSRLNYPRLYAHALAEGKVVSDAAWLAGQHGMFSSGDGSSTFRLPMLGGRFIRLADDGVGLAPGHDVGVVDTDSIRAHSHGIRTDDGEGFYPSQPGGQVRGTDRALVVTVASEPAGGFETRPVTVVLGGMIRF